MSRTGARAGVLAAAITAACTGGCDGQTRCDVLGHIADDGGVLIDKRTFIGEDLVDAGDDPVVRGSIERVEVTLSGADASALPARIELPPAHVEVTEAYLLLRSIADDGVLGAVVIVRHGSFHCDAVPGERIHVQDALGTQVVDDGPVWWNLPFMELDWSRELAAYDLFLASVGTVVDRTPIPLAPEGSDIVVDGAHVEFTAAATVIVAPEGAELACSGEAPPASCPRARLTLRHRWDIEAPSR